jgi:hypothetical protein
MPRVLKNPTENSGRAGEGRGGRESIMGRAMKIMKRKWRASEREGCVKESNRKTSDRKDYQKLSNSQLESGKTHNVKIAK